MPDELFFCAPTTDSSPTTVRVTTSSGRVVRVTPADADTLPSSEKLSAVYDAIIDIGNQGKHSTQVVRTGPDAPTWLIQGSPVTRGKTQVGVLIGLSHASKSTQSDLLTRMISRT